MDVIDAIRAHSLESLYACLLQGQDPNHIDDYFCITPLHYAVANEFPEAVALLLAAGANPNIKMFSGETPLMLAQLLDKQQIVQLLQSI